MDFAKRLECLRESLIRERLDAFLVHRASSIFYFSGFLDVPLARNFLLVPIEEVPTLFVGKISYTIASKKARNCKVEYVEEIKESLKKIGEKLSEIKARKVGFDELSTDFFLDLTKKTKARLKLSPELIWNLRKVKDEEEIACLRKAAEIVDLGIEKAAEVIQPGLREYDVAAEVEFILRKKGSEAYSFDTIIASGPNSAIPHSGCTNRILQKGDFVIVDIGATYQGYRSNITRTFIIGKPSRKHLKIYRTVSRAQEAAVKAVRKGRIARTIDKKARQIISKVSFAEYFVHGTGHGIGIDVHEPPYLRKESKEKLQKGNVVTIEPAIYIPRFGGVRIEDMVLVLEDRGERLTKSPREP